MYRGYNRGFIEVQGLGSSILGTCWDDGKENDTTMVCWGSLRQTTFSSLDILCCPSLPSLEILENDLHIIYTCPIKGVH